MSHQGVPVRRRFSFARCASYLRISVLHIGEYVNFDETIKNIMNYSEIIRGVLDVAVKISGEEESVIISSTKTKKISTIRSIVLFVLHNDMSVPTSKIAEKFGRSRRSIFWHCNKMSKQLPLYKEYREIREEILRMLS